MGLVALVAHNGYSSDAGAGVEAQAITDRITPAGLALIDDLTAAAQRTTLGIDKAVSLLGATACVGNPNYPAASKGDAYLVSSAGKIGGGAGTVVDVGDWFVASADNAGGTQVAVGASWFVLQANLVGAVLAANNLSELADKPTARTNLGLGALAVLASIATGQLDNAAVTYAKFQNVSATDKLLGRSTAGAGSVEEITCTAAGRALLDDADAAAQRATLGLGTAATQAAGAFDAAGAASAAVAGLTLRVIASGLNVSVPTAANTTIGTYTRNANEKITVLMFLKDDTAQAWHSEVIIFYSLVRTTNPQEFVLKMQNVSGVNQHADWLILGAV